MFRNKKLEVKVVKDENSAGADEWSRDLRPTVQEVAEVVVTAYILMKGFSTLCSAVEHFVVTKVK